MAKKRRLRKTASFDSPQVEEVKEEPKKEIAPAPEPAPEPVKKPEASKKSISGWLKGSSEE